MLNFLSTLVDSNWTQTPDSVWLSATTVLFMSFLIISIFIERSRKKNKISLKKGKNLETRKASRNYKIFYFSSWSLTLIFLIISIILMFVL